jgi:hypothetical protein
VDELEQQEYFAYLKVMDGYRDIDKNPCEHKKAQLKTTWEAVPDSNLEVCEVLCCECQTFIALAYRKVQVIQPEASAIKVIQTINAKYRYGLTNT